MANTTVGADMTDQTGDATMVDDGVWMIDLGFQGHRGVVAAYLLAGEDDLTLIETGPTSTLPALMAGIRAAGYEPARLSRLLVSHIHLDHSGAAGVLVQQFPHLTVGVHPVGLPHLVDPAKLLASAGRLYGDRMDTLWGEVAPIPADRVIALADTETLTVAGRGLIPLFTPGHASHHIAYWDQARAALYTGDVGGARMAGTGYVCPPPPPPELNPEAWAESVRRMRALKARRLYLTHGGPFEDVASHLAQIGPNLEALIAIARDELIRGADFEALTARLHAHMAERLADADASALERLEWATPSYLAAAGLTRLLTKRGEVPARQ